MLVIRATKKLRDRVKGPVASAGDTSTTVLGDWFANALFWQPQVALLVNQRTLLPVFMPLAPAATLLERIPEAIATALRQQGAGEEFVAAELAAMGEVRLAPTNDRSTGGVMRKFAVNAEFVRKRGKADADLDSLSRRYASMIVGPLMASHGSPDRELAAILRGESPSQSRPAKQVQAFQLKVTLLDIKPPVWRRLLVETTTPLHRVHECIQAAFGWWNYHLYEFKSGGKTYGDPDPDWDDGPPVKHARKARLNTVADIGDSFVYTYDFGDGWEHEIVVEESRLLEPGETVPACIGGRRACPPEDSGGPGGYRELLAILSDTSHPEHAGLIEWVGTEWGGGRLDPEWFDPAEFAVNLAAIRKAGRG